MNSCVTYGDLVWYTIGLVVGSVLAHIGTDLVKLAWQRHKTRT